MTLVQFNPRVDERMKRAVRKDAVDFNQTNDVIATALMFDFFRRYPKKADRRAIYEKMAVKVNGANGNGRHEFPVLRSGT